jgi:hypothetical protein
VGSFIGSVQASNYTYNFNDYIQVGSSINYNHGGTLFVEDYRIFIPKEIFKLGLYEFEAIELNADPLQFISAKCDAFEVSGSPHDSKVRTLLPSKNKIYYSFHYTVIGSNGRKNVGISQMLKRIVNNETVAIEANEDGSLYLNIRDSKMILKKQRFKYPVDPAEGCSAIIEQGKFRKLKNKKILIRNTQIGIDYNQDVLDEHDLFVNDDTGSSDESSSDESSSDESSSDESSSDESSSDESSSDESSSDEDFCDDNDSFDECL